MHILNRLKKAQSTNTHEITDSGCTEILFDIRAKCMSEARIAIQGELDQVKSETADALSQVTKSEAESTAAKTLQEAAEKITLEHKTEALQLRTALKAEQEAIAQKDREITDQNYIMSTELKEAKLKAQELEIELSSLKGKLSVNPKPVKQIQAPIPSFNIDVVRGSNERIVSATITPVRPN